MQNLQAQTLSEISQTSTLLQIKSEKIRQDLTASDENLRNGKFNSLSPISAQDMAAVVELTATLNAQIKMAAAIGISRDEITESIKGAQDN